MRRQGGFTLIELLVVIAIIALLVSILVPSLSLAKDLARRVICGSNLHHLAIALHTYAMENEGMGPAYRTDGSDCPSPSSSDFNDWTLIFYGGTEDNLLPEIPGRRKLNPYIENLVAVCRCPSDVGGLPSSGNWYDLVSLYELQGTSYWYNSNWYGPGYMAFRSTLGESPWVLYGVPYESFDDQSRQILIAEAALQYTWTSWAGAHISNYNWHDPPRNHPAEDVQGGTCYYEPECNVAFLDGHVQFMRLGPYDDDPDAVNTDNYILDPRHPR